MINSLLAGTSPSSRQWPSVSTTDAQSSKSNDPVDPLADIASYPTRSPLSRLTHESQSHAIIVGRIQTGWASGSLEVEQPGVGFVSGSPAHLFIGPKPKAHRRSCWMTKETAAVILCQLHTTHPGRLALRHPRDG